jgi:hypothetical protein
VPEWLGGAIEVVDFGVELAGGGDAKVAIYNLNESKRASV